MPPSGTSRAAAQGLPECLLLYFDILGYSTLVEQVGVEDISRRLTQVEEVITGAGKTGFDRMILSDTYLMWRPWSSGSLELVRNTMALGTAFLARALAAGLPMRGALVRGTLLKRTSEHGGGTLLGTALVRAHKLDRGRNLIGVVVAPDVAEILKPVESELVSFGVVRRRSRDQALVLQPLALVLKSVQDGKSVRQLFDEGDPHVGSGVFVLRFLLEQQDAFFLQGDYEGRVAQKYIGTLAMIRDVLGPSVFSELETVARGVTQSDYAPWFHRAKRLHASRGVK